MDLISRQAAIEAIKKEFIYFSYKDADPIDDTVETVVQQVRDGAAEIIEQLPSAQPEAAIPITWLEKHIEWLRSFDNDVATFTAGNIIGTIAKWRSEQNED